MNLYRILDKSEAGADAPRDIAVIYMMFVYCVISVVNYNYSKSSGASVFQLLTDDHSVIVIKQIILILAKYKIC